MQKSHAHVYIKGDVIGVGFRAWTKIQAKMIGVNGWIRNTFDKPEIFDQAGGIEAVFAGSEENMKKLIEVVKQGSPIAHVDEVNIIWIEPKHEYTEFEIRPTKHAE